MKIINSILFLLMVSITGVASAGTITSGGALSLRYAQNPWWLENTPVVRYCIDMAPEYFADYTEDELAALIETTFGEWKTTFETTDGRDDSVRDMLDPYYELRIATQKFVRASCSEDVELRFQLGRVTPEQSRDFPNLKNYLGVAVQTSYDMINLRGKGFIYISPLAGDLAPPSDLVDPNAWSKQVCNGCILKLLLRHELGHLFGLRDGARSENLMDDALIDGLTQKSFTQRNIKTISTEKFNLFFAPINLVRALYARTYEGCEMDDGFQSSPLQNAEFWDQPESDLCAKVAISSTGQYSYRMDIYSAKNQNSPYELIGWIDQASGGGETYPLITVGLPPEQEVFKDYHEAFLTGEDAQSNREVSTTYHAVSGIERPLYLKFRAPGWETLIDSVGYLDGQLIPRVISVNGMYQ